MILPTKHIDLTQSLLGLGATVLRQLDRPATPSRLWERVRTDCQVPSYERFVLALNLLYTIEAIYFADGILKRRGRA